MDELARRLALGPATFPHALDAARDMLLLVELGETAIAQASFLDQRVLTPGIWGRWIPLEDVRARIANDARDDAHYIFHIGHVGSTLVSRLLGEAGNMLALREPLILRDLAALFEKGDAVDAPWPASQLADRLRLARQLLARTFRPDQRAMVKATSFTSEIAPQLVQPGARALFLTVSPRSYLATILAGETSRAELAAATGPRLTRLARRLGDIPHRLWALDEGERIALGWATEMLSLHAAAKALPASSVLWLDFDDFLARPVEAMLALSRHFGLGFTEDGVRRLLAGPIMQRYSKAPEHAYSAGLRHERLQQALRGHAETVARGLDWLAKAGADHPLLAAMLEQRSSVRL